MIDVNKEKEELLNMIHYLERFVERHKNNPIHLIDAVEHMSRMKEFNDAVHAKSEGGGK